MTKAKTKSLTPRKTEAVILILVTVLVDDVKGLAVATKTQRGCGGGLRGTGTQKHGRSHLFVEQMQCFLAIFNSYSLSLHQIMFVQAEAGLFSWNTRLRFRSGIMGGSAFTYNLNLLHQHNAGESLFRFIASFSFMT